MNTAVLERPLQRAQVTVQYVNPPKGPRQSGSIKDVDGQLYSVWPNMLAQFAPGETYEIGFEGTEKNGVLYRNVKTVKHITPYGHQPSPQPTRRAAPASQSQQQQRTAPVLDTPHPQPAPQNGNGNGGGNYRPTHPRDAERMFCCSILNAFIQTGRVENDVGALTDAVQKLRQVWSDTFGQDHTE